MVTQGNIEAEQEAQRKREKKKAEEEARAKVCGVYIYRGRRLPYTVYNDMKLFDIPLPKLRRSKIPSKSFPDTCCLFKIHQVPNVRKGGGLNDVR